MHLTILGRRWRFEWFRRRRNGPVWGECDPPDAPGKTIRVAYNQPEKELLDTVIHEVMHAADWHRTEEWVGEFGTDLSNALWRLGYRRVAEHDQSARP